MAASRTSTRPASRRSRARSRRRAGTARIWVRRGFVAAVVIGAGVLGGAVLGLTGKVDNVIQELTLPLRHEDIIRQEAREKDVDAALIAAVIYAESKFTENRTSSADARGLMQIQPETALHLARKSHATTFTVRDLADPDINIRYGTYYLRDLLRQYNGNEVAALAAYNAGQTNVDRWGGAELTTDDIGFPETAAYVNEVLEKREDYRKKYAKELGY